MSYYSICPNCGASLDPGERCSCTGSKKLHDLTREECLEEISSAAGEISSMFVLHEALRFIRILHRREVIS